MLLGCWIIHQELYPQLQVYLGWQQAFEKIWDTKEISEIKVFLDR
jgi:hypothetical protein